MMSRVFAVKSVEEANEVVKARKGIAELPWCGREECGLTLEESLDARVLGFPVDEIRVEGKCINCDRDATNILRIAKTY